MPIILKKKIRLVIETVHNKRGCIVEKYSSDIKTFNFLLFSKIILHSLWGVS